MSPLPSTGAQLHRAACGPKGEAMNERIIFWKQWGPRLVLSPHPDGSSLRIEDLNPQLETTWVLTAEEVAGIGHKLIMEASEIERAAKKMS